MSVTVSVKLDRRVLTELRRELGKAAKAEIQVGVFQDKTTRADGDDWDNAALGAVHELGSKTRNIPARSFLKMPLMTKAAERFRKLSTEKLLKEIREKGAVNVLKQLGHLLEKVVDGAFTSRGYGHWKPNTPATIAAKGSDMPLIDSGLLRKSVSSRVEVKQ